MESTDRSGRRCVLVGMIGVFVVVTAIWIGRWYSHDPFHQLRQIAATFPVPEDWKVVETGHVGAPCRLWPSCTAPQLTQIYAAATTCDDVHDLFARWAKLIEPSTVYDDESDCAIQGEARDVRFSIVVAGRDLEPLPRRGGNARQVWVSVVDKET